MPENTISSNVFDDSEGLEEILPNSVIVKLVMEGDLPDFHFMALFCRHMIAEAKWENGTYLERDIPHLNLNDFESRLLIADNPIILLLRYTLGKGTKETDLYLNPENKYGAAVDLLPLLLGEPEVFCRIPLVSIESGIDSGCVVQMSMSVETTFEPPMPLTITMMSGHCLPALTSKDPTSYICALGLDGFGYKLHPAEFGLSLATPETKAVAWANASQLYNAASTKIGVPNEDFFVPSDLNPRTNNDCSSVYWYSMKRILVDQIALTERLQRPFFIDVAGVPTFAKKAEVRCRYMGMVDAGTLLEPGVTSVNVSAKLLYFNEQNIPAELQPALNLPPISAKMKDARESEEVKDENKHDSFVIIRFDLLEPLNPKTRIWSLLELLGHIDKPNEIIMPYEFYLAPVREDPRIDVHRIHKEGGALAVHYELRSISGFRPERMPQSIKRTAASRLLMRVRGMMKQFQPGECSEVKNQDTITSHHSASRRAVMYSFEPQPPPLKLPNRHAAIQAKFLGDNRVANAHIETILKVAPNHPRSLLLKALQLLEERNDNEAFKYISKALKIQTRNRYILWAYGSQIFDKDADSLGKALAAFRIAVKGDYSDGTANAIGWAAIHALYHFANQPHAAFIAAKKMRKAFELPKKWPEFLAQWEASSGSLETFWAPKSISQDSPLLLSAAFFLCLRCYALSGRLMQCYVNGCGHYGSRVPINGGPCADLYYIRSSSFLLRKNLSKALQIIEEGLKLFGPSDHLCQMRLTCILNSNKWNPSCDKALNEAIKFNSLLTPALLLQGALNGMAHDPDTALQRAAYAHKLQPSAYTALVVGRVYKEMSEMKLAERWAAAAVTMEPLLANGWAFLALVALHERDVPKARALLRTAHQAGPIQLDIMTELKQIMISTGVEELPEVLVKNLCFCDNY